MYRTKIFFTLLISLFALCSTAQERTILEGRVVNIDSLLENVYLKNITTGRSTVTNLYGEFLLLAKAGDTLLFSHVAMYDLIKFVDSNDVKKSSLIINMKSSTNELEEVTVTDVSRINAVSLGIIPKEIKSLTLNERRLQTAGDFKWIHLLGLLVGNLQVDPILNAINGRTKKLKRNILIDKKIQNIAILEGHRDYIQNSMDLTDQQMGRLIYLAVDEEEVQMVIDTKNDGRMQIFLLDTWMKFKQPEE
ncbi:carboxypeptidase-like regulatory domain-containing protein [Gillisia hiemivivida]|uniref:Carboxypeptidase-like regulatory domain-containing protein n=1 Tax=Gillisia hiemivivida TaxID=291190 RepID=A0A5C6ZSD7_9FLAO|nr:carboxypeptidase-like regulatory domain-containing protein [Gillisia hiemivivida]TXD93768.1 carboxypeptidase-like regulatory domain-containing protein [Gillisia hiemivivida]